jgi:hypothetical protein
MLPLPLVWVTHRTTATRKTSYHLQEVVKEAPARAQGQGPFLLRHQQEQSRLGRCQITWRWALDPLSLALAAASARRCAIAPLVPYAVPTRYPGVPGGTRGRGGRGRRAWAWKKRLLGLDWATSPSPPPATGHESSYLIPGYWGSPAARLPPAPHTHTPGGGGGGGAVGVKLRPPVRPPP